MRFVPTPLEGAFVIEIEPRTDDRGFFARVFDRDELAARGLDGGVAQCNLSFNARRGTLRGMHYQLAPRAETKLVRCIAGAIYDVIVDLRPGTKTHARWFGIELSADNRRALYVPKGFAHGYQTLSDAAEIYYQVSEFYSPEHERGVRWNDPAFAIAWPIADPVLSPKDAAFPDYRPAS